MITYESPSIIRLHGYEAKRKELASILTYRNKAVDFELSKFKKSAWFLEKYGQEAYDEKLAELKAEQYKCLLFEDDNGMYTYSGLAERISNHFNDRVENSVVYPPAKLMPWANKPTKQDRDYQSQAHTLLTEEKHAAVEIGTGLGKSFIILKLVKFHGLKTVIMAPSTNIARQLYEELKHAFGSRYVGLVGDGKKEFKKQFVVGIAASLAKCEKGSDTWQHLSQAQVFIADESHMCPASTLANVCFGLVANAPYRYFFSGTQVRNDGATLLLEAITGKIVFRMTVKEGVDQGYLARPIFRMIKVGSLSNYYDPDSNKMTRKHLFYNARVNHIAADIANKSVDLLKHPVLILVDEVEQLSHLLPHLRFEVGFAHGGLTKDNMGKVPEAYHKSDPEQLVKDFNDGKLPILIGTSCIATGTDIRPVKTMIYLRGGTSEIEVKQGVGRCTRRPEGKTFCNVIDFDVEDVDVCHRHAEARKALYNEIYGPVEEITYGSH